MRYTLPCGRTSKALHKVEEARHKWSHITGFHLYEEVDPKRPEECCLLGADGVWKVERVLSGYGVSLWGEENILELDKGGGCLTS